MRRAGYIWAAILVAAGAAAVFALPHRPALVSQPEFFDAYSGKLMKGSDVVQTFTASGTAVGAEVMYTSNQHSGPPTRVTAALIEVRAGTAPASSSNRVLAQDTVLVGGFPHRAPMSFSFAPVALRPGVLYGLRLGTDAADSHLVFMRDTANTVAGGRFFQEGGGGGALAFRIDGSPVQGGLYDALRTAKTRPMYAPALVIALLLALLAAAGMLIGEAPAPVVSAEEADGRRAA